jgi:hypothetical protein
MGMSAVLILVVRKLQCPAGQKQKIAMPSRPKLSGANTVPRQGQQSLHSASGFQHRHQHQQQHQQVFFISGSEKSISFLNNYRLSIPHVLSNIYNYQC